MSIIIKSKISVFAALCVMVTGLGGCGEKKQEAGTTGDTSSGGETSAPNPVTAGKEDDSTLYNRETTGGNLGEVKIEDGDLYAVMTVRDYGEIVFKLFPESAPKAVDNFKTLADSGYYDGKLIHRVIPNFMFQGGSPTGTSASDPNYETFGVEASLNMRHFYGALSMANAGGQNAQQFFVVNNKTPQTDEDFYYIESDAFFDSITEEIRKKYQTVGGSAFLDGGYSCFGQMTEGGDVIDEVSKVVTGAENRPVEADVVIESVEVKIYGDAGNDIVDGGDGGDGNEGDGYGTGESTAE